MFRSGILFSILAGFLLLAPVAHGATLIVQPDGSGDYSTIQAAVDAASDGDVIELGDGTFSGAGNWNVTFAGKAITIRSQAGNPENCIIDVEGIPGNFTNERGFVFENGEGPGSVLQDVKIINADTDNY